jgi:hypothetical protein
MDLCTKRRATTCLIIGVGLFGFLISPLFFPTQAQTFTPEIRGHSDSLDVPFVPSHNNVLQAMFELAKPTKDDYLIDLGSGDGRIVIAAAHKFGTRGFGVDLNEGLVRVARERARRAGVGPKVKFEVRDIFETDIRKATILTMYLLPDIVQGLRPNLLRDLRPGTRILSHDYHLGSWRPDATRIVDISPSPNKPEESVIYYWLVPAKIAGSWEWTLDYRRYFDRPLEYVATLKQHFQDLEGVVETLGLDGRVHQASLSGTRVAFSADVEIDEGMVRHDFSGEVKGDTITGTVRLSGSVRPVTLP